LAPPAAAVVAQVLVPSVAEAALLQVPVLADLAVVARLLDLADLVVEAEALANPLSRQSFSAAMARTTP
jgi:hypothetical protein